MISGLIGSLGFVYLLGTREGAFELKATQERLEKIEGLATEARAAVAARDGNMVALRTELTNLQQRYAADVPQGDLKRLTERLAERLAAGVRPDRIEAVLGRIENERGCEPAVSRRLVVRTPIAAASGGNVVLFGDGAITVTGEGVPTRDAAGNPEAWYDPMQPVTVRFLVAGGRGDEVAGLLPLQRNLMVGEAEYRFTLAAGGRGFLVVTGDRCRFP